jgi:hypothetical protein
VSFLRILPGLCGVFHGLFGVLVSGKVFSLAVLCCCRAMGMRSHLVKFSRSLVRIVCHVDPVENGLAPELRLDRVHRTKFVWQGGIEIHCRIITSFGPDGRLNLAPRS